MGLTPLDGVGEGRDRSEDCTRTQEFRSVVLVIAEDMEVRDVTDGRERGDDPCFQGVCVNGDGHVGWAGGDRVDLGESLGKDSIDLARCLQVGQAGRSGAYGFGALEEDLAGGCFECFDALAECGGDAKDRGCPVKGSFIDGGEEGLEVG